MSFPTGATRFPLLLTLAGAGSLAACTTGDVGGGGGGSGPDAAAIDCQLSGTPSVTLGGGTEQSGFVDMADGGELTAVLGPQGLYMVTPSVRALGMYPGAAGRAGNPDDPEVLVEIFLSGTLVGGSAKEHLGLTRTADGDERLGIFTPFTGEIADYVGQTVTLHASVSDACGNSSTDDLTIVVRQ